MPGTVEDAAAEVSARGGTGIGVVCDHTDPAQVEALVARIEADHGRLDVLVNNAWGGYEQYDGASFTAPFWEQPLERRWDAMFGAGVWPTMLTSHRAAPLLPEGGLIACTIAWAQGAYTGSAFYDAAKACIARFAFAMAHDLRERRVTAVAVAPGFMRTERVMAAHAENPFDLAADRVAGVPRARHRPPRRRSRPPGAHGRAAHRRRPGARLRLHRRRRLAARGVHDSRLTPQDRGHDDVPVAPRQLVARSLQR